ncbi:4Fe-4S dicluster domain-containing protein [Desulfofundulus kuznetsovii]|uniref:4Fe-4S dicluster domain-containing protein n=1 Tax=Desulfofundulus kuznetsovii TaxID=58135 RepID=UPI00031F7607
MEKVLDKAHFSRFLGDLVTKYKVIGPTKKGGATSTYTYTTFDYVKGVEDLEIDYKSSMLSPKRIYFPDSQPLYKYEKNGQNVKLQDLREVWDKERVLFGLRPCDITAILCLDKVFMEDSFVDHYYQDKRRKSIIIGLTCSETRQHCFCNSLGSGPDIESGYDLLMTDIGDSYFFRAKTDLGKELISADYFRDATDQDRELREAKLKKVKEGLSEKVDPAKIISVMADKYNDELWNEFSDNCFTCGACNMVCPTCHCFTIIDKTSPDGSEGTRVLVWDSCHFDSSLKL